MGRLEARVKSNTGEEKRTRGDSGAICSPNPKPLSLIEKMALKPEASPPPPALICKWREAAGRPLSVWVWKTTSQHRLYSEYLILRGHSYEKL